MTPELAQMPGYRLPGEGKAMQQALGLALLVEILALTAVFYSIHHQHPVQVALPPMRITLVTPEPPAKPVTPPTPTPKPKVEETPKPVLQKMTPKPHPQPTPPQPIEEVLPPSPVPSPVAAPPAPETPAPPPPSPSLVDPAVREDYLAQVKGAIQAAVRFPENARMLGEEGRVQLRFLLHDGQVGDVEILRHGAMEVFDRAAIVALQNASLPGTPQDLTGKNFTLTVWVEFRLHRD